MKRVEAPCPQCGANVEFKVSSSLVTVCEYCQSVVARGDAKLEDFGKVGRVVPMASPFALEEQGYYRDKPFEVVGHIQYEHAGGGVWNEWYAAFPGDRWGWLAEAQGKIYLLFKRRLAAEATLPGKGELTVGESLAFAGMEPLTVAEIGTAKVSAAEGEMPFLIRPGQSHQYVDLAGAQQSFATLEYDDEGGATLYLGQEVTLQDLGMTAEMVAADAEVLEISSLGVTCPHCGGSLELRMPDQTQRVVCPFCDSLLDADQGNLKYLQTLEGSKKSQPVIPVGATGKLRGHEYTIVGFMRRSVTYDRDYYWSEYLLYSPELGFRWLVHSEDHWSFVEPLSPGEVISSSWNKNQLTYKSEKYKLFQRADARVRYVLGEFYWKVHVGQTVEASDYINPPNMISVERSAFEIKGEGQHSQEINYSLGNYLPVEELEAAFSVKGLRRGWGVAPNQPKPVQLVPLLVGWGCFVLVLGLIDVMAMAGLSFGKVDQGWFWMALIVVSLVPGAGLFYNHSFEVKRWEESDYSPYNSGD